MLIEFARNYAILGDTGKRFVRASEAHQILTRLSVEKPNELIFQRDLSVAFLELGEVLVGAGQAR